LTFQQDDRSVEGSRPVELFTFTSQRAVDPVIARSTSYHRDVVFGGFLYTARPIRRGGSPTGNMTTTTDDMTIEVPTSDPVAQFYLALGTPPQNLSCRILRLQLASGQTQLIHDGIITECVVRNRTVTFQLDQPIDVDLATPFPPWQVSKRCQRVLYDGGCKESRIINEVATTITTLFDLKNLHVGTTTNGFATYPEGEFLHGELEHKPSGERRRIVLGTPTKFFRLDVQLPSNAQVGDDVTITRGCTRSAEWCRDKFGNVANFGGNNLLPRSRVSVFDRGPGILKVIKEP